MSQLDWISDEMEVNSRKFEKRVFQIQSFVTLQKFGDTHGHKEQEKDNIKKLNETSPLLPKSQPQSQPLTKAACLTMFSIICGLMILIAFSITMGIIFSAYKGGGNVNEIMKWRESNCTIYNYQSIYSGKDYFTFFNYYLV